MPLIRAARGFPWPACTPAPVVLSTLCTTPLPRAYRSRWFGQRQPKASKTLTAFSKRHGRGSDKKQEINLSRTRRVWREPWWQMREEAAKMLEKLLSLWILKGFKVMSIEMEADSPIDKIICLYSLFLVCSIKTFNRSSFLQTGASRIHIRFFNYHSQWINNLYTSIEIYWFSRLLMSCQKI